MRRNQKQVGRRRRERPGHGTDERHVRRAGKPIHRTGRPPQPTNKRSPGPPDREREGTRHMQSMTILTGKPGLCFATLIRLDDGAGRSVGLSTYTCSSARDRSAVLKMFGQPRRTVRVIVAPAIPSERLVPVSGERIEDDQRAGNRQQVLSSRSRALAEASRARRREDVVFASIGVGIARD